MALSHLQKMEILINYNTGKSMRDIAEDMKINLKTVNRWIKRYAYDKSLSRKRGTGLYKKVNINLE